MYLASRGNERDEGKGRIEKSSSSGRSTFLRLEGYRIIIRLVLAVLITAHSIDIAINAMALICSLVG